MSFDKESITPRTDAIEAEQVATDECLVNDPGFWAMCDHARQLERELTDEKTCSANLAKAYVAERDALLSARSATRRNLADGRLLAAAQQIRLDFAEQPPEVQSAWIHLPEFRAALDEAFAASSSTTPQTICIGAHELKNAAPQAKGDHHPKGQATNPAEQPAVAAPASSEATPDAEEALDRLYRNLVLLQEVTDIEVGDAAVERMYEFSKRAVVALMDFKKARASARKHTSAD